MSDDAFRERIKLILDAALRSAPRSPPRSQLEIDDAFRQLLDLSVQRPDQRAEIDSAMASLMRECHDEGLREPLNSLRVS